VIRLGDETNGATGTNLSGGGRLFGRDRERSTLQAFFERGFSQGEACRVVLVADPGLGKSVLAEETVESFQGRARVATARCQPWGLASLAPLEEVLLQLVPGLSADPTSAVRSIMGDGEDVETVVGQLTRLFGWSDRSETGDKSVWSVRRLLEALAEQHPLMLLIDDLHWAEEGLVDALEDLAVRLEGPVAFLAATRPDLLDRRPGLAAESTTSHVVRLAPFDPGESRGFVEALLDGPIEDSPWLDDLIAAAQGSPLFLAEAVEHLQEVGGLVREPQGWRTTHERVSVSPNIQVLLTERIKSLPIEERDLAHAAATWYLDFGVDEMQALLASSIQSEILGRLARLHQKNIIESVGPKSFRLRHALIRDVAYFLCPKEQLVKLHLAAALYARDHKQPDALIGHHLEQAFLRKIELFPDDPTAPSLAIEASRRLTAAGISEREGGGSAAAFALFSRAIALHPHEDAEWVDMMIEAAECARDVGRQEEAWGIAHRVAEAAARSSDPVVKARADLLIAEFRVSIDYSIDPQLRSTLLALAPIFQRENDDEALVEVFRGLGEWNWFNGLCAPSTEYFERALEHSLRTPRRRDVGHLMASMAKAALWGPMPVPEAIELCERLKGLASDDAFSHAQLNWRLASLVGLRGDFERARDWINESKRTLAEIGQELVLAVSTQEAGMIELLAGNVIGAHDEFKRGFDELTRFGDVGYRATNAALLGRALYLLGRIDEAVLYLDIAEETKEEDPTVEQDVLPIRAQIAADRDEAEEARSSISRARETAYATDAMTVQAHVEVQAVEVFRKLGSLKEFDEARARATDLCTRKQAPALQRMID
jgi:tetratricopeptide (TPR) repeat protein